MCAAGALRLQGAVRHDVDGGTIVRRQRRIDDDEATPAPDERSRVQQVGSGAVHVDGSGQAGLPLEPGGHLAGHAVVAGQRVAEREHEHRFHTGLSTGLSCATGSRTVKQLPCPTVLSTSMSPPCLVMMP